MKKLLILSVLLGLMALPMVASDITFGGDVTWGFIGDFGDEFGEKTDLNLDVMATIDDYSSLTINIEGLELNVDGAAAPADGVDIQKALVTTDVGMWLDLPVGVVVSWGFDDPDANEFGDVTEYGNQAYDFSPTEYWGIDIVVSASFFEVELAFDPGLASADAGRLLAGVAVKEPIPGLNAEVYYFQNEVVDSFEDGSIGVGAGYATEFGDISLDAGVNFEYILADVTPGWLYTVGAAVGYGDMVSGGLALAGLEDDALGAMSIDLLITPFDMADIYAGALMSFVDGTDTFQGADLGINAHIGAVEVYLGYLINNEVLGAAELNADFGDAWAVPQDASGAYIKFDVDY